MPPLPALAYLPVAGLHLPAPVWWFYALGPQLALCLAFGYWTWRRRHTDLLDWLTVAFVASLIPVAGVVAMIWLWYRSPRPDPGGATPRWAPWPPADERLSTAGEDTGDGPGERAAVTDDAVQPDQTERTP